MESADTLRYRAEVYERNYKELGLGTWRGCGPDSVWNDIVTPLVPEEYDGHEWCLPDAAGWLVDNPHHPAWDHVEVADDPQAVFFCVSVRAIEAYCFGLAFPPHSR